MSGKTDLTERPRVLIWEVTQACDLECEHCRADAIPERDPRELSTEEAENLLDEARSFGEGQLVVLSGGDPLKRPDVEHLVRYGTDLGLRMTMTPSGTHNLGSSAIEELSDAGLQRMALSIDGGSAEAHDGFRGEPGSFQETMEAAEHAQEAGIPLQINTTVCSRTLDELYAVSALVDDLDAVLWSVFFLVPVGRGTALEQITPEEAERTMEWLADVQRQSSYAVKTTEAPQYRRVLRQRTDASDEATGSPESMGAGVRAGAGFAFVSHTGEIYPSGFLPKSAGNVRNHSVADVYRESDLFTSLREPDDLKGKCGACEYRYLCGGSRSRAYAKTGDPLESDPLCSYVPEGYTGELPWNHAGGVQGGES